MIEDIKQELKSLMEVIEGMDQTAEDFSAKLGEAEALKLKLENAEANAKKLADLKQSVNAFPKPQSGLKTVNGKPSIVVGSQYDNDPKFGFQNAGEFLSVLANKSIGKQGDERLDVYQTSGQHTTSNDGLMLPAELMPEINVLGKGISHDIVSLFDVKSTSRNSVEIRRDAATTRGSSSVGLVVGRAAEVATFTASRQKFELDTIKLDKLYVYAEVSDEDLEDFAMLESNLTETAPELLRIKMGEDIIGGNGVGRNLGFTAGNDYVTSTRTTASSDYVTSTRTTASRVKAEDVALMMSRHLRGNKSFWLINQSVWNQLPIMTIGDQPIFQSDFTQGMAGRLLGLPVYTSEDCAAMGTTQDIMLVNPDGYCALQKTGGSKFNTSMHVKFDSDVMAFKWTMRFGGIPKFNAAYTPRKGATLSHFNALTT
jgi:HK97 family phage major capsid protein